MAIEKTDQIGKEDWRVAFGDVTDDEIEGVDEMSAQLHTALQQLTTGEPFDLTQDVEKGNGLECWRKLARRYGPATGGRTRKSMRVCANNALTLPYLLATGSGQPQPADSGQLMAMPAMDSEHSPWRRRNTTLSCFPTHPFPFTQPTHPT